MDNRSDQLRSPRPRLHGVRQIVRFNWPHYVASLLVLTTAIIVLVTIALPPLARLILALAVALVTWWALTSLIVSYWVYDHARVADGRRIARWLEAPPRRWALLLAGVDDSSVALRAAWPVSSGHVIDIYDRRMHEPSVARARAAGAAGCGALPAAFDRLPFREGVLDAVFLVFAAHEIRSPAQREQFFGELRRILTPGGRVIVVEHARDAANFVAFGPGFMHFLPAREWPRLAAQSGLVIERAARWTPLVRAFILRRPT